MKAITIKQPFASLIAAGLKEFEFRTWKTSYRGPILIHAGKTVDKEAMIRFADYDLTYPLGCIVAKAELTDCIFIDNEAKDTLRRKIAEVYAGITEDADWVGYGLKLENIERIAPIPAKGMLGLWEYRE